MIHSAEELADIAQDVPRRIKEEWSQFKDEVIEESIRIETASKTTIPKDEEKTKLMCLSGVKQYPMRVKCATLSWHTLTSAINNTEKEINTEEMDT